MVTMYRTSKSVTSRQIEVLEFLAQREHWLVGEVAVALGVSSAAATKAIARLERKGLATRSVDMLDRRCVNVRITRAGNEAVRRLHYSGPEQTKSHLSFSHPAGYTTHVQPEKVT